MRLGQTHRLSLTAPFSLATVRSRRLTLKATRGTFRWVSGKSKSSAYKVNTPFGTLGVRGTVVDIYIGSSTAAVVVLEGQGDLLWK